MPVHKGEELQKIMHQYSSMKSMQILMALADCKEDITLAELSSITGISPSSTYRILQEMQHCGFVLKEDEQKRYRVGFQARLLAMQLQKTNFLYEASKDEMTKLNEMSLETVHLIGEEDMQAVYLAKRGCKNSVGLHSAVGKRVPLYCTGGGKALLAWKSEEWLNNYIARTKFEAFTPHTITNETTLRRELNVIRVQGYSLDNHEHHSVVVCIAAPIFDINNTAIATIGIAAPDYRFPLEKALAYSREVLRSAEIITHKLGGEYPITLSNK